MRDLIAFLFAASLISLLVITSCGTASAKAQNIPESRRSKKVMKANSGQLSENLNKQALSLGAPLFIRIVKSVSGENTKGYLEVFVQTDTGAFKKFKSWDICTWSGVLGPKFKQGDGQSPEGFYFVRPNQLNPNSSYHLSFNLGYPNAYDRAHGRTGDFLMVHGKCVSIGCYAMTDDSIDEIYTLMQKAFEKGQPFIRVHIFPFEMTEENLGKYENSKHANFWQNLKTGWDWFETHQNPPNVTVNRKRYSFAAN